MKLEFRGDWDPSQAQQIAIALKKSLSMSDQEDAGLVVPELLSDRQKKLLDLLKQGAGVALEVDDECDRDRPDWSAYTGLSKSGELTTGQVRVNHKGKFRLNKNRRWERIADPEPEPYLEPVQNDYINWGSFQFPVTHGVFGDGVYFDVGPKGENLRIRLLLAIAPEGIINDAQFYQMEDDLTLDTNLILDANQVQAIVAQEGDRVTQICVRDRGDIEILGIVGGSGGVPMGTPSFTLVSVEQVDAGLMLEVEMVSQQNLLRKGVFPSSSFLGGMPLVKTDAPSLDRKLVKEAIARCEADGIDFSDIEVKLVDGHPDFLSAMIRVFCLPSDGRICLVPHDPQSAIAFLLKRWTERMQSGVGAGIVTASDALDVVHRVASLDPEWWLEGVIKRYVGAIQCDRRWGVLSGGDPPAKYMDLLVARGAKHWGTRRAIAECMAEDYRIIHDPAGLPNQVTCEWDLVVPGLARAAQELLSQIINDAPTI